LVLVNLPLVLMGGHALPWPPLILLLVAPSISTLFQLALSRTREFDADLDGAELTGDPAGLASALQKLERYQGGLLESVMLPGRKIPDPSLLRTHPKTEERVRRLLSLSKELSGSVRAPLAPSQFEGGHGRSWGAAASRRPRWHYWNGLCY
jgi:heat shock protein HtpX